MIDAFYLAGDSVTVEMHQQPNDRSCSDEAIGGDHWGPINVSLFSQISSELLSDIVDFLLDLHGKG